MESTVTLVHLSLVLCPLLFTSRFRLLCQSIIAHKLFDYVVLVFIFLNCITVALERPKIHQGSVVRINFPESFQYSATTHRTWLILLAAISRSDQINSTNRSPFRASMCDLCWWFMRMMMPWCSILNQVLQIILVPQQAAAHFKAKSKLVKCVCKWWMKEQFD